MRSLLGIELPFYSYGILMGVAFILGVWLFYSNSKKCTLAKPAAIDLLLVLAISGVAGARINYILLFPQYYHSLRDCLALHEGGLVFYGGFIAALAALWLFCKIKKYSFGMVADYLTPSLAIGHAMGRVGCLINDCCYGAHTQAIKIYRLKRDPAGFYRHPTQLYEIIYLSIMAAFFTWLLRKGWAEKHKSHGLVTAIYTIMYGILRFLNENLRADNRGGFYTTFQLSPAQVTSIILVILGTIYIIRCHKKNVDCGEKKNE